VSLPTFDPSPATDLPDEDSSEIPESSPLLLPSATRSPSGSSTVRSRPKLSRVVFPRAAAALPTGILIETTSEERRARRVVLTGRIVRAAETD